MTGGAKCVANLKLKEKELSGNSKKVIVDWANEVLRESQTMCPVDTGNLRRSGRVSVEEGSKLNVEIGYTAEYAVSVHEIPRYHPNGQWKYLSTPFESLTHKLQSMLKSGAKL